MNTKMFFGKFCFPDKQDANKINIDMGKEKIHIIEQNTRHILKNNFDIEYLHSVSKLY